jgi:nucleotide-binding universal stress UspA family protein
MSNAITKVLLAAVDGSEGATAALKKAATAATAGRAQLVVLTVTPRDRRASGYDADDLREFARVEHLAGGAAEASSLVAEDILKQAARTLGDCCGGVKPVYVSRAGNPAEEILACAKERAAAALYLGSRGLGPLGTLFLGSVSKHVAHAAACPVMIVPKDE